MDTEVRILDAEGRLARLEELAYRDPAEAIGWLRSLPETPDIPALEAHLRKLLPMEHLYPQRGPQQMLAESDADLVIYGGAAGGGKTWAAIFVVLLEILTIPGFEVNYFRKSRPEIVASGGLWRECQRMWQTFGPRFREQFLDVTFPNSSRVKFEQLYDESERSIERWKGAQISMIVLEEVTGLLERTAVYLLSRNRSPIPGVRGRSLWTCNPDRDSWVFTWVRPWVDPNFSITAKHGEVMWFRRFDEGNYTEDVAPYVLEVDGDHVWVMEGCPLATSMTFIGARLEDNPILMDGDPSYEAKLEAQDPVMRARLREGDWLISYGGGVMFNRVWFTAWRNPDGYVRDVTIRSWDFAVTKNDGDYTAGVKISRWKPPPHLSHMGYVYVIEDVIEGQWSEAEVQTLVHQTARRDGKKVRVVMQQGKGDAGRMLIEAYRRFLPEGTVLVAYRITGDKITRAKPYSGLASRRQVYCVVAPWNARFVRQHDKFPDVENDDIVDAASVGILHLAKGHGSIKLAIGSSKLKKGLPQW